MGSVVGAVHFAAPHEAIAGGLDAVQHDGREVVCPCRVGHLDVGRKPVHAAFRKGPVLVLRPVSIPPADSLIIIINTNNDNDNISLRQGRDDALIIH